MPGLSFSPFNQQPNGQQPGQVSAPVQDAIKILSFRMPSVVGGGAPAPQGLLGGQSAGGTNSGLALQFLQRFLQGQGAAGIPPSPQTPMGGAQTGSLPGLGATNPFAPSADQGVPSAPGGPLTPGFQYKMPRPPDPNAPPQPPPDNGYQPPDQTPGWLPPGTAGAPDAQNPNPIGQPPTMPRAGDPSQGQPFPFQARFGGLGINGRY